MKKKIFLLLLTIVTAMCFTVGLIACDTANDSDNKNTVTPDDDGQQDNDGNVGNPDDGQQGDKAIAVTGITLNKTVLNLEIETSEILIASVLPDNATDKTVSWTSSNTGIATVDENGKVTAVATGTAIITASASNKTATCEVTVKDSLAGTYGLEYLLSDDKTSYICMGPGLSEENDIVIANIYNGLPVTEIAESAFEDCTQITGITIPENIVNIGKYAFRKCENLTCVYWNAVNCQKAGNYSGSVQPIFPSCYSLTSINIADNVIFLPEFAFYGCSNIKSITIPDSVVSIDEDVFTGCTSLNTVILGKEITHIGQYAFKNCSALTDVYYNGNMESWCLIDFGSRDANPLYYAQNLYINKIIVTKLIIPYSVTQINYCTFTNYAKANTLELHDGITSIGSYAFAGCAGLKSVTLPDGISSVGSYAFSSCSGLLSVTLGENVASVGESAFSGCTNLNEIYYNAVNCRMSYQLFHPFNGCNNVSEVIVGDKVAAFSTDYNGAVNTFNGCAGLQQITVNSDNINFASKSGILYDKNLTNIIYVPKGINGNVVLPDSLNEIGASVFKGCKYLTTITIPDSVKSIGMSVFTDCTSLTDLRYTGSIAGWCSIDFECSPLEFADNLYINNELITEVVIPDGVTQLPNGAFSGSSTITQVVVPDSVTFIEESALKGCSALISLTLPFVGTELSYGGIFNVKYSEFGSLFGYQESAIKYNVNVPASLKNVTITGGNSIDSHAFEDCTYIESISLPESLSTVGSDAFKSCRLINSVFYTGNIASWCGISFSNSYSNPLATAHKLYINGELVTELNIPETVTSIGNYAFYGASSIVSITIPDTVNYIGIDAFNNTGYYTNEANWQDSVLYIGNHLIKAKSNLYGSYTVKDGTLTIAGCAFSDGSYGVGCGISNITIPDSVIFIGNSAFKGCYSLSAVVIPEGVQTIYSNTFNGCSSLISVTIPVSVTNIEYSAFGSCRTIRYNGTTTQWNAIKKDSYWGSSYATVYCTDGNI